MSVKSSLRILHASPGTPAVDVFANGNLIAENLSYKEITNFIPVEAGSYNVQVFPTGVHDEPVIDTELIVLEKQIITVAAVGVLPEVSLLPILQDFEAITPSQSLVRFAHLSPTAPTVDITLPDGNVIFGNISYLEISDYLFVESDTYHLQVRIAGTDDVILQLDDVVLQSAKAYTIYAVGLYCNEPPLEALIIEDKVPDVWKGSVGEIRVKDVRDTLPNDIRINFNYVK